MTMQLSEIVKYIQYRLHTNQLVQQTHFILIVLRASGLKATSSEA